jgi:hypothetical protein
MDDGMYLGVEKDTKSDRDSTEISAAMAHM